MNRDTLLGLVNNTALLLALAVLYETIPLQKTRGSRLLEIFTGLFVGAIGLAIMLAPWQFSEGVIFDTRSILLSLTGLFFGLIPTTIAALVTGALRLYQGGAGTLMGVSVILTSAGLGLIWRYFLRSQKKSPAWYELYGFGVIVHLAMLLWTFVLPRNLTFDVLSKISLPVMLIYPVGTVLLGLMLTRRNQRIQSEWSLQEERDLFALISETSPVGIVMVDASGQIEYANARAESTLGLSSDRITQRTYNAPEWKITDVDGGPFPEYQFPFRQVMDTGKPVQNVVHAIEWPNKERVLLSINAAPLFDRTGQVNGIVATIEDITERKRAEEVIHKSEKQFKSLFMSMSDGFYLSEILFDDNGNPCDYKYVEVNPKFEQIIGLSRDQIIGKRYKELVPVNTTGWLDVYFKVARTGTPQTYEFYSNEYKMYFETYSYQPVKGQVSVFVRNITERKQSEQALRESEEKYRTLFENMAQGAFYQRADDVVVDCNPAVLEMFGLTQDQFLGRTSMDPRWKVIREDGSDFPGELHPSMEALRTGKPVREVITGVFNPRKEDFVWLSISAIPMFRAGEDQPYQAFVTLHDLTERMQAEGSLRESEERFRKVFEEGSIGMVLTSRNFQFFSANPAFCQMLGYTVEELSGNKFLDVTHPDHRETDRENVENMWQGKIPYYRTEKRYIAKNGDIRWGSLSASLLQGRDGDPLYALAMVEDITDRKRAEAALRESEEEIRAQVSFLNTIMEQSPFAMWISDSTGTVIRTNRVIRETLNLTDDQLLGKYNVLKDNNLKEQGVMPLVRAVFEEHKPARFSIPWAGATVGDDEFKEANDLWIDVSMFPIVGGGGNLTNVVCQWVDITEQKRAEDALRDSEKTYRELIDGMNETVWVIDFDGNLIDVNKNAVEISGYSKEELLTIGLYGIDSSLKKEDIKTLASAMPSDRLQIFETIHTTKDGRSFPVEVYSSLVTYRGHQAILSIARDITDRKKMEREVQDAYNLNQSIIETSPVGIWIYEESGQTININRAGLKLAGGAAEELLALNFRELQSWKDTGLYDAAIQALESGHLVRKEIHGINTLNQEVWYEALLAPVKFKGKKHLLLMTYDIKDRRKAENEIKQSRQQLRALTTYLQTAIEDERSHISREIHDEFGQRLTALKMDLVGTSQRIPDGSPELATRVGRMTALVDDTINKIRQLSSRLRPGLLDDLGLSAAIEWQANSFQEYAGIECTLDLADAAPDLPTELATGVFRIFQEALTNVARHSQATEVHVKLSIDKKELMLEVQDNGRGIMAEEINRYASLGLLGMQERVRALNGEIEFLGEQGEGTTVKTRIPLGSVKQERVA